MLSFSYKTRLHHAGVSKTREQYRFKEEGKKCRLTEDQISQLDSIGFQWRVGRGKGRSSWDEYYQDLLHFHQEHGHFNVPINYAPNPSLASWANVQRSNYRSQVQGRNPKGKSVREQNQKLIELGFNFHVDPEGGAIGEEDSPCRKRNILPRLLMTPSLRQKGQRLLMIVVKTFAKTSMGFKEWTMKPSLRWLILWSEMFRHCE